ncbi:hypothetical protein Mapa_006150 [Marchantia paleacea]|nr:hypothetical protein Mapa_006150 [Marchantia paleacea]
MFKEDVELQKSKIVIRTLAASYDSSKYTTDDAGRVDIFLIGESFVQTIIPKVVRMQTVSDRMIPIVLVAHSFGGLVVQEMISHAYKKARPRDTDANAAQFLKTLSGVFFYSTPHGALKDATYQEIYGGAKGKVTSDVAKLQTQHNKNLNRNREHFVREIAAIEVSEPLRNKKKIQIKSVFENLPTTVITAKGPWTGMIVGEGSSKTLVIGDNTYIDADHFNICRPLAGDEGFLQNQYVILRDFIQTVVESEL